MVITQYSSNVFYFLLLFKVALPATDTFVQPDHLFFELSLSCERRTDVAALRCSQTLHITKD